VPAAEREQGAEHVDVDGTEFDPSGSHLIALYQRGVGIVWDVDPKLWERRACTVAGHTLTQEEWKDLLPARSYQPTCR